MRTASLPDGEHWTEHYCDRCCQQWTWCDCPSDTDITDTSDQPTRQTEGEVTIMRKRRCKQVMVRRLGGATMEIPCLRERHHDGPHTNAFTQDAWVIKTLAVPVTYRWPYEDLIDDAEIVVKSVGEPQYRYTEKDDSTDEVGA